MKKTIGFLVSALLLLPLCACGESDSSTLKLCVDGTVIYQTALEPILAEFSSQHPDIALEVEYLPAIADRTNLEARTAALTQARTALMAGEGADVYLFAQRSSLESDLEAGMLFPDLERHIEGGVFHDLDFLYQSEGFQAGDYLPALTQAGQYQGKSYLLPITCHLPLLIGVEENLQANAVNTAALLTLPAQARPALGSFGPAILFRSLRQGPVSVEAAAVQLNTPAWQSTLEAARQLVQAETEQTAPEEAFQFETLAQNGAAILPAGSTDLLTGSTLRVVEQAGYTARMFAIANEDSGVTMRPYHTAAVAASCRNTDAAASLLLFLLDESVQSNQTLPNGGTASLNLGMSALPVRRGSLKTALEGMEYAMLGVVIAPGPISETLQADIARLEERVDSCAMNDRYTTALPALVQPYLDGTQTWEECYAAIEKEWSYLDE